VPLFLYYAAEPNKDDGRHLELKLEKDILLSYENVDLSAFCSYGVAAFGLCRGIDGGPAIHFSTRSLAIIRGSQQGEQLSIFGEALDPNFLGVFLSSVRRK
jgi:hypothetical protein